MRVKVVIDFGNTTGTQFEALPENWPEQINVQAEADIAEMLHNDGSRGYRGFQFNSTKLDGSYKFFDLTGYPGIITRQMSDAYGVFASPVEIDFTVNTQSPKIIWISFDSMCKEYATKFSIVQKAMGWHIDIEDNKATVIGVPMAALLIPTGATLTLQIHEWSKPNASAKVTKISPYSKAEYTGKDLIDFVCSENLLDSNLAIQSGICEQYADVSVYDRDSMLHACAYNDILVDDYKVVIYALNDATHDQYTLGTYYVSDWDINGSSTEVGISSIDISYIFDKINVPAVPIKDRTVDDMLTLFFGYAQDVNWKYFDDETAEYCKSIMTPDSWFRAGTLRELLNKICAIGMLRIYWYINKFIVARCW